jgi:hypothetical protein
MFNMGDIHSIKMKLFDAWDSHHSFAVNKSQLISSLDNQIRELLEIALIQEHIVQIQTKLHSISTKSSFEHFVTEIESKNLVWLCDLFIKIDGSISEEKEEYILYLLFKEYCQGNGVNAEDLINEYLVRIRTLPFYPVYDEIFMREMNSSQDKFSDTEEKKDATIPNELTGFPKMWFHLGSLGKTLLGGILLLILFAILSSLSKIAPYLVR